MDTGELQPKQESQDLSEALQQEQPGKAIIHMHTCKIIIQCRLLPRTFLRPKPSEPNLYCQSYHCLFPL